MDQTGEGEEEEEEKLIPDEKSVNDRTTRTSRGSKSHLKVKGAAGLQDYSYY